MLKVYMILFKKHKNRLTSEQKAARAERNDNPAVPCLGTRILVIFFTPGNLKAGLQQSRAGSRKQTLTRFAATISHRFARCSFKNDS
jgi:hypothetical protein